MPDNEIITGIRDVIVNFLTDRSILNRYIINTKSPSEVERILSRNTKFSPRDLIAFLIMPRAESTTVELQNYAAATGGAIVRKQTFFIKRMFLSDTIFDDINQRYVSDLYLDSKDMNTFLGLYPIACDGTTVNLPDTPAVREEYPVPDKTPLEAPQARAEVLRDTLNGSVVAMELAPESSSERELAIQAINRLPDHLRQNSVFIFDRGYAGAAFMLKLQSMDVQYAIRLPKKFNKEIDAFYDSDSDTADVIVEMSRSNWHHKGKHSFEAMGLNHHQCPPLMIHLVKARLCTGETEVLAYRIKGRHLTPAEGYALYGLRWGVETAIDEFKNQLQLEVFSGNSPLAVRQDVKAKVIAYNIGVMTARAATAAIGVDIAPEQSTEPAEAGQPRVRVKVNLNVGWYYIKVMIAQLLTLPRQRLGEILTQVVKELEINVNTYVLDRHLPHNPKPKRTAGKYITFTNYKRAI